MAEHNKGAQANEPEGKGGGIKFHNLLNNKEFSDMKVSCGNSAWNVHKAIVCSHSPVLAAAITGCWTESQHSSYEITGYPESTVHRMLSFMYTGDYDTDPFKHPDVFGDIWNTPDEDIFPGMIASGEFSRADYETVLGEMISTWEGGMPDSVALHKIKKLSMETHLTVAGIADCYLIPALGALARSKLEKFVEKNFSPDAFLDVLPYALNETCDKPLQEQLAMVAVRHFGELAEIKDFMDAFETPSGGFIAKLMRHLAREMTSLREETTGLNAALTQLTTQLTTERIQHSQDLDQQRLTNNNNLQALSVEFGNKEAATLNKCKATVSEAQRELQVAESRADNAIKQARGLANILNTHDACSYCELPFPCHAQEVGFADTPTYVLRCDNCGEGHRLPHRSLTRRNTIA